MNYYECHLGPKQGIIILVIYYYITLCFIAIYWIAYFHQLFPDDSDMDQL